MTKPWETYESTIKALYQQHTLASVKQIMLDQYGFKASTRAYRQRLDKWGVTKYKTKKRNDNTPGQVPDDSQSPNGSNSNPSSPVMSSPGSSEPSPWTMTTAPPGIGGIMGYVGTSWTSDNNQRYPVDESQHHGAAMGSHRRSEPTSGLALPSQYNYAHNPDGGWNDPMNSASGYPPNPNMGHPVSGVPNEMTYSTSPHHAESYTPSVYQTMEYNVHGVHPNVFPPSAVSPYAHDDQQWDNTTDPDDGKP